MEDISYSTPKKRYSVFIKGLVLLSAFSVTTLEAGFIFSLGKLFIVIMSEFGSTRAETAAIQSTTLAVFLGAGIVTGALIHRFGPRKASLLGAICSSLGLVASFFATSLQYLLCSIGICTAFGSSILYISSAAIVGKHFVGRKCLVALSVLSVGTGIGGMVYPYLLTYLNDLYGLRGTLLITGGIKLNCVAAAFLWGPPTNKSKTNFTDAHISSKGVPVARNSAANENTEYYNGLSANNSNKRTTSCIKNDIETNDEPFKTNIITNDPKKKEIADTTSETSTVKITNENKNILKSFQYLFRNRCFVLYAIGLSLVITVMNVYIIFTVDIFSDNGLSDSDSSFGLLLLNIFSIVGRLLPGIIMQKSNVSAVAVPIVASMIGTAGLIVLLLLHSLEFSLIACCVIGLTFGMLIAAVSVTTITLVGKENFPNAIGIISTLNGICNAATGPLSGMIRDETGSYRFVFVLETVFAVVGLVFFMIALRLQTRVKQNTKQREERRSSTRRNSECPAVTELRDNNAC